MQTRSRLAVGLLALLAACRSTAVEPRVPEHSLARAAPPADAKMAPEALRPVIERIQAGLAYLQGVPSYSARFLSHERIDGELQEPRAFDLRLRRQPFSVYLHCKAPASEAGREMLYDEASSPGKLLVHTNGLLGALAGTISIDPNGSLAMSKSRYPITNAGLERMAELLSARLVDSPLLPSPRAVPGLWGKNDLERIDLEAPDRRVRIGFDPKTSVATAYRLEKLEDGKWQLIEEYRFEAIDWTPRWTDAHFRPNHPDYDF